MLEAVVVTYLATMVVIGVYVSRRVKITSDFLIAGRKLGLPLTTATLAAVQLGAGVDVCPKPGAIKLNSLEKNRVHWKQK